MGNPCHNSSGLCGVHAFCLHTGPGRHQCKCNEGFVGDGMYCEENCRILPKHCKHGSKLPSKQELLSGKACTCENCSWPWAGLVCDECTLSSKDCAHGGVLHSQACLCDSCQGPYGGPTCERWMSEDQKAADAESKRRKILSAMKEQRKQSVTLAAEEQSATLVQRVLNRGFNGSSEALQAWFSRLIVESSAPSAANLSPGLFVITGVQHGTILGVTGANTIGTYSQRQKQSKTTWHLRTAHTSQPGLYSLHDDRSGRFLTAQRHSALATELESPASVFLLKTVAGTATPVFTLQDTSSNLFLTSSATSDGDVSFQKENGRASQMWKFALADASSTLPQKLSKSPVVGEPQFKRILEELRQHQNHSDSSKTLERSLRSITN